MICHKLIVTLLAAGLGISLLSFACAHRTHGSMSAAPKSSTEDTRPDMLPAFLNPLPLLVRILVRNAVFVT